MLFTAFALNKPLAPAPADDELDPDDPQAVIVSAMTDATASAVTVFRLTEHSPSCMS